MKCACLTIVAVYLTFAAGTVTGRVAQHSYDKPAMTSAAERSTLRIVDGSRFTRTEGGNGSFLNYVCAERKKTGVQR